MAIRRIDAILRNRSLPPSVSVGRGTAPQPPHPFFEQLRGPGTVTHGPGGGLRAEPPKGGIERLRLNGYV